MCDYDGECSRIALKRVRSRSFGRTAESHVMLLAEILTHSAKESVFQGVDVPLDMSRFTPFLINMKQIRF